MGTWGAFVPLFTPDQRGKGSTEQEGEGPGGRERIEGYWEHLGHVRCHIQLIQERDWERTVKGRGLAGTSIHSFIHSLDMFIEPLQ